MSSKLLRNRNFVLLWLAQIISTVGTILYNVGVMVTVFDRTGSALQTTGVVVAMTLPSFLLGPIAGVLVDRYPRKWMMVAMDLIRAILVGLLLVFISNGQVSIWGIYAVVAGLAAAGTFYNPAKLAIVPSLMFSSDLVQANSLIRSTNQATTAFGYAVGGTLILRFGFQSLVTINLISFISAALLVAVMTVPKRIAPKQDIEKRISVLQAMVDGLTYLRGHSLARSLVILEILEHWPHALWTATLMLAFTQQALRSSTEAWGFQVSAYYVGELTSAIVSLILIARLARRPGRVIVWQTFINSALAFGYASSPTILIATIISFAQGLPTTIRNVTEDSLLQSSVQANVLGRVFATRDMFANLSYMLAGVGLAWLADQIPVRWVYFIGAFLYLGTAFYASSSLAIRQSRITKSVPELV